MYPKRRSHDAESLFADRQGRLYVVTKTFFGGTVYRAPLRLSRSRANRLQPVGGVREFATDAALMRDGRHLLVRGYDSAGVYTFPVVCGESATSCCPRSGRARESPSAPATGSG